MDIVKAEANPRVARGPKVTMERASLDSGVEGVMDVKQTRAGKEEARAPYALIVMTLYLPRSAHRCWRTIVPRPSNPHGDGF